MDGYNEFKQWLAWHRNKKVATMYTIHSLPRIICEVSTRDNDITSRCKHGHHGVPLREPYVGDDYKLIVSLKDRWKVLGVRSWSNATWKFRLHDYRGPSCVLAVNCHSEFKCLGRNYNNP